MKQQKGSETFSSISRYFYALFLHVPNSSLLVRISSSAKTIRGVNLLRLERILLMRIQRILEQSIFEYVELLDKCSKEQRGKEQSRCLPLVECCRTVIMVRMFVAVMLLVFPSLLFLSHPVFSFGF